IQAQLNERNTEITSFRISDYILTVDPTRIWDEYVRTNNPIDPPQAAFGTPVPAATQRRPAPRGRQKKLATIRKSKTTKGWPPARWTIVESLGEGGQGWTFKVHRKGDSNKELFVLKRLKNKDRLPRLEREIAALTKLQH